MRPPVPISGQSPSTAGISRAMSPGRKREARVKMKKGRQMIQRAVQFSRVHTEPASLLTPAYRVHAACG